MMLLALALLAAPAFDYDAQTTSFRSTLDAFVKADTTNPPGNEARIVQLVAERLKKEGIAFSITEFAPGRQNIVARLKGAGAEKPLLLLAHIDVVGTANQAWSTPPHVVTEKDGYLYGRGVLDDLAQAVLNLETIIALKRSGTKLRRDVILALTGDEESGGAGVRYLIEHDPSISEVGLVINEGGGLVSREVGAKPRYVAIEVAQKTYQDYQLTATGITGHSSLPHKDNAVYRLAEAVAKLGRYQAEPRLLPATRAFFQARSAFEEPAMARAMQAIAKSSGKLPRDAVAITDTSLLFNALLRTTCVATMLDAGTKANALAAKATATVNCRILPDETLDQVEARLRSIVADPRVVVSRLPEFGSNIPSPLEGEFTTALHAVLADVYPNIPFIPTMMTGATDSRFFRAKGIPSYGFAPLVVPEGDDARCHGIDERLETAAIRPGLELNMRLVLALAGA